VWHTVIEKENLLSKTYGTTPLEATPTVYGYRFYNIRL
jgi:hypothetical protein